MYIFSAISFLVRFFIWFPLKGFWMFYFQTDRTFIRPARWLFPVPVLAMCVSAEENLCFWDWPQIVSPFCLTIAQSEKKDIPRTKPQHLRRVQRRVIPGCESLVLAERVRGCRRAKSPKNESFSFSKHITLPILVNTKHPCFKSPPHALNAVLSLFNI